MGHAGSNSSLAEKLTHRKRAPFATHQMQIHGHMFYSNANNNKFMHLQQYHIIKMYWKYVNLLCQIKYLDTIHL